MWFEVQWYAWEYDGWACICACTLIIGFGHMCGVFVDDEPSDLAIVSLQQLWMAFQHLHTPYTCCNTNTCTRSIYHTFTCACIASSCLLFNSVDFLVVHVSCYFSCSFSFYADHLLNTVKALSFVGKRRSALLCVRVVFLYWCGVANKQSNHANKWNAKRKHTKWKEKKTTTTTILSR